LAAAKDPLADPRPLIRRVYAFVAYRIGPGPEAEDVTSETFAQALRYRDTFDPRKGDPASWLIGIARRCLVNAVNERWLTVEQAEDRPAGGDLGEDAVRRLSLADAVAGLSERDAELVALRYGADLTARQIGEIVGLETNAVEVALHRALRSLRRELREPAEASTPAVFDSPPRVRKA
jgi:RNA polymerase sigma factor (sigma-70 family)